MATTLVGKASGMALHAVTLQIPAGVQPGDQLYLFAISDQFSGGGVDLGPVPAGWTNLGDVSSGTTNAAAVLTRTAQAGDAGAFVTVTFTDGTVGAHLRAYRGDPLSGGQWLHGEVLVIPVALDPGDLFVAFAWTAGSAGQDGIHDPDGHFASSDRQDPDFAATMGVVSGVAPAALSQVRLRAFLAATGALQQVWAFALVGKPAPEPARIRSHVSEDAGSLFQATQAVAVESAVSLAFPFGTDIAKSGMTTFREALTPDQVTLRYYPLPTRNQEMLTTVEGETNLGRMARAYPSPIMTRVADIPGRAGDTMTAQEAIQHVFDHWASEFPWFQPLPVPDLRLLVPEAVADPRQYYIDHPEAGVVTIEAIAIPQDGDNRRTMREIIDEWLSIFPGTIVRQDSQGRVELVPRVGPDAPVEVLELEWRDILSMSDGEDDPRGVINRARVESQGWEFADDQAVIAPAYILLPLAGEGLSEDVVDAQGDLPSDREETRVGDVIPLDGLVDTTKTMTVTLTLNAFGSQQQAAADHYTTFTGDSDEFELDLGETATLSVTIGVQDGLVTRNVQARVTVVRDHVGIRITEATTPSRVDGPLFTVYLAWLLEIDAVGTKWTRATGSTVGVFSLDNDDFIPSVDDPTTNALSVSESTYGEREAVIRSDVFQLTPEQAQAVAQGHVLFNINPRTVRDVQQSEWRAYPVRFDHIGRLVDLPNGERAVVENRSYADSFAPDGGFMQSSFTATVTELVIDTTTEYLHHDNGDYMRLDDGTLVEAS